MDLCLPQMCTVIYTSCIHNWHVETVKYLINDSHSSLILVNIKLYLLLLDAG
jgi:hypothetical protein